MNQESNSAAEAESGQPDPLNDGAERELTIRQRNAIDELAQGRTLVATAQAVGVDRVTVYRWLRTSAFRTELELRRREVWTASIDGFRSAVQLALSIVIERLQGRNGEAKLKAATLILKLAGPALREALAEVASAPHENAAARNFVDEMDDMFNDLIFQLRGRVPSNGVVDDAAPSNDPE